MPYTTVRLTVLQDRVQGLAAVPLPELQSAWQAILPNSPMDEKALHAYFREHISARALSGDSQWWGTEIVSVEQQIQNDSTVGNYAEVVIKFILVPQDKTIEKIPRAFRLRYDAVLHQVVNHKALVFIEQDWQTGIYPERAKQVGLIGVDVVSGKTVLLNIELDAGSWVKGFLGMFRYGAEHILYGVDHILFLLILLVVAPLTAISLPRSHKQKNIYTTRYSWSLFQGGAFTLKRFLWISAAFTLGHSLTLVAGVYDWVWLPTQWIEVVIALSIAISAAHAMRPLFASREFFVAGLFGLVHGLAFANGLNIMELDSQSKILSLFGFNLGIEFAQCGLMLLSLPLFYLSRFNFYHAIRWLLAAITMVAALIFFWNRIFV